MKSCNNILQTSEFVLADGVQFEMKRFFSIPVVYFNIGEAELLERARQLVAADNSILIAARRITVKEKEKHSYLKFKRLNGVEIATKTHWNVTELCDFLKTGVLHPLADPIILLDGDKRRAKHRIMYYVALVAGGMDEQEALSTIYG